MHPKYNPFSFHLYLGKYSDSVIHPGIAYGELKQGQIKRESIFKFQLPKS